MRPRAYLRWFLLILTWVSFSCNKRQLSSTEQSPLDPGGEQALRDPAKVEAAGLHNVYRITNSLYSGSSPDGDEGFRSLNELGVKTVISVDGARPDVATAHRYGLRYVHLPFGYDGIPRQRILELAKAVRELPGPFYIHCHHGKHRGPTAAAAIHLCLDEKCSAEQAVAEMRRAGTDPHYIGLYAVPQVVTRPTAADLDRVPAYFPEMAQVPDLAQVMVEIDGRWENLKLIRAAGWATPSDHADLDPPHEAIQLVEQFREAARLTRVKGRPEEFGRWLAEAEKKAVEFERVLRRGEKGRQTDHPLIEEAFRIAGASCLHCHAKYRDVPH